MTKEQLDVFLTRLGYNKIESNLPEFVTFFRVEHQSINALSIIDCSAYRYMTSDQYEFVKEKVRQIFTSSSDKDVHILSILVGEDIDSLKNLCLADSFCWFIEPKRNQLMVPEGKSPDFYGLRRELEVFLQQVVAGKQFVRETQEQHKRLQQGDSFPYVVVGLITLNVIVFILCAITGDLLYNIGDLSIISVLGQRAYYRIISSIFLHADINHLVSNMLILYYIGEVVEVQLGHIRFSILYLVSGVGASIASMFWEVMSREICRTVGASGAVYGLMGALLFLIVVHKGRFRQMTVSRVVFMIAFSLYSGFTSAHVNNAAHVGGLLTGLLAAVLLWISIRKDRRGYES